MGFSPTPYTRNLQPALDRIDDVAQKLLKGLQGGL